MKNKYLNACIAVVVAAGLLLAAPSQAAFGAPVQTVYRLYHSGTLDHHYTTDTNEYQVLAGRGWQQEGVAWASRDSSAVPVYRLYHEGTRDHHYTKDSQRVSGACRSRWRPGGHRGGTPIEAQGVPVYRLYHEGTLNHHYTKDYNEYQVLAGRGWKQEALLGMVRRRTPPPRAARPSWRVAGLCGADGRLLSKERWRIHVSGQCV